VCVWRLHVISLCQRYVDKSADVKAERA